MSARPKIAVIGAGAAGLSTALNLAEQGARDVVVLDRAHVAAGSSVLSAGVFTRQYMDPVDVAMRQESYLRLCQLERDQGLALHRNGFLRLAHDAATMAVFRAGAQTQRDAGIDDARALDPEELRALIPDMRCDDLTGGLYSPTDGYLDGQQLCMAYAAAAENLGVRILARRGLTGREDGDRHRHRLLTAGDPVDCDIVINAAGPWAGVVGDLLGAPVPMAPERHQACIMRMEEPLPYLMPSIMDYVPGSGELGLYLRPEGERQLLVGLHSNDRLDEPPADPDNYYGGIDAAFVDELIPKLVDRLPSLDGVGLEGGWSGLYPNSPDDQFIIGPCSGTEGVFAVCGLNGVGVYMSPVVGRLAATWALGEVPDTPGGAERYDPRRFAGGPEPGTAGG
jgi:sarcosine oxidase subunit beta